MSVRFDADNDAVVEGTHPYDVAERGGERSPETLWYLTENQSNGRWLFVDEPDSDGSVPLGIARVYTKRLSPAAAKSLAGALLVAAASGEGIQARRMAERDAQAERKRQCEAGDGHQWGPPPTTTTHATAAFTTHGESHFVQCVRCDGTTWLDGDAYRAALPLAH